MTAKSKELYEFCLNRVEMLRMDYGYPVAIKNAFLTVERLPNRPERHSLDEKNIDCGRQHSAGTKTSEK